MIEGPRISLKLRLFLKDPLDIRETGDDTPASSLLKYVWRMSGWQQVAVCLIAIVLTLLNLAPIEMQRRIVNEVVEVVAGIRSRR